VGSHVSITDRKLKRGRGCDVGHDVRTKFNENSSSDSKVFMRTDGNTYM
jgi:hypothetical protein